MPHMCLCPCLCIWICRAFHFVSFSSFYSFPYLCFISFSSFDLFWLTTVGIFGTRGESDASAVDIARNPRRRRRRCGRNRGRDDRSQMNHNMIRPKKWHKTWLLAKHLLTHTQRERERHLKNYGHKPPTLS